MKHPTTIDGRVGTTPELRFTAKGTPVCSFTLATKSADRDLDGNQLTEWVRVTCWAEHAEIVAKAISKGDLVSCQGNLGHPYVFQIKDTNGDVILDDETGYPKMDAKSEMTSWRTVAIEYAERPLEAPETA